MEKIIARVALTRWGVAKFVEEVNAMLADGYHLTECTLTQPRLKILCLAKFWKPEPQKGPCDVPPMCPAAKCCEKPKGKGKK